MNVIEIEYIHLGRRNGYHGPMPLDPISAAIVGSILGSAIEAASTPAPPPSATGLVRFLPADAKRGVMRALAEGQVQIDGQTLPLAPGVMIRNESNMILPLPMVPTPVLVRYQTDTLGAVQRIWLLSPAEAALADNP
ncbi:MAG: hypothetical protein ACK4N6_06800 [Rhodocyclaceae bacterium]